MVLEKAAALLLAFTAVSDLPETAGSKEGGIRFSSSPLAEKCPESVKIIFTGTREELNEVIRRTGGDGKKIAKDETFQEGRVDMCPTTGEIFTYGFTSISPGTTGVGVSMGYALSKKPKGEKEIQEPKQEPKVEPLKSKITLPTTQNDSPGSFWKRRPLKLTWPVGNDSFKSFGKRPPLKLTWPKNDCDGIRSFCIPKNARRRSL